jgi:hypothetical protein
MSRRSGPSRRISLRRPLISLLLRLRASPTRFHSSLPSPQLGRRTTASRPGQLAQTTHGQSRSHRSRSLRAATVPILSRRPRHRLRRRPSLHRLLLHRQPRRQLRRLRRLRSPVARGLDGARETRTTSTQALPDSRAVRAKAMGRASRVAAGARSSTAGVETAGSTTTTETTATRATRSSTAAGAAAGTAGATTTAATATTTSRRV